MEAIKGKYRAYGLLLMPVALCAVVYWHGLNCWFIQDDFAWLGLNDEWNTLPQLLDTLFKPMAQGTIRPISERAFFMVFRNLFDLDALPYRLLVLLTQFANLIVLNRIAGRLTNSPIAGLLTATLWCLNSVLAGPLSWTSSYNQILCSFVLLLGFYYFLRFADTGLLRYYIIQWAIFLVGFGVLEENVIYPALAVLYSAMFARKYVIPAVWMVPASVLYALVHNSFAKGAHQGIYAIELGAKTLPTLFKYWTYSVWPSNLNAFAPIAPVAEELAIGVISVMLLSFVLLRNRKEPVALFGFAWYLIAIGPYLLVPNHICSYYPVVPTIGLSLVAANAMQWAWSKGAIARTVAAVLAVTFAVPSGYSAWLECFEARKHSEVVKHFVLSFDRLSDKQKSKNIFLQGIDDELFQNAFFHSPFRLLGMKQVYIVAEDAVKLTHWNGVKDFSVYSPPETIVLRSLDDGTGVVLRFSDQRIINITSAYRAILAARVKSQGPPKSIDPSNRLFQDFLKEGWYAIEDGHRWMSQHASAKIRGRYEAGQSLHIVASCVSVQQSDAPFLLSVTINGTAIGQAGLIARCDSETNLRFPLPTYSSNEDLEIVLSLDKTSKVPPDTRLLGCIIHRIEIR